MNLRKSIGTAALAVGLMGTASIAAAAISEIEIRTAPPPPRVEVVPVPREGFIYEPGHYSYDGEKYVWADGRFIQQREGRTYTPYALERRGDNWYFRPGYWDDQK